MRARPRPRHGWLAPTASPHALARWGWLKARRSSGRNPASTEARAVRSPDAHGPFTGGLSSCHRRTEFARRNARRRAAGAGSVPRAGVKRALEPASSAGALERARSRGRVSGLARRARGSAAAPRAGPRAGPRAVRDLARWGGSRHAAAQGAPSSSPSGRASHHGVGSTIVATGIARRWGRAPARGAVRCVCGRA